MCPNNYKISKVDCIKGAISTNQNRRAPHNHDEGIYTCSKCNTLKHAEEFSMNLSKWNGLDSFCKECKKEYYKSKKKIKWKKQ